MDYSHPNNFLKPQFTTAEVLKLVGVEYETLRRWLKLGYIRPSMENPGRGRQRLYSLSDIMQIATIHLLSGIGFMPSLYASVMAKIVSSLVLIKLMEDWASSEDRKIDWTYWTTEKIKETKEFKELYNDYPEMAKDFELINWTPEDRYILIFENSEGEIESKVSASSYLERGVWLTVDVHGILNEALDKINKIKEKSN
jgi:hypothetical protein